MSSKKIKLTNMNKWVTVNEEDYDRVNQFNWFGVFQERTQSIHAVRAVEIEKGIFELELMEEFILKLHPKLRKTKKYK
jgi:hypothetical protein